MPTDDARERVEEVLRDSPALHPSTNIPGLADRILDALRDSEGREVVAEGWVLERVVRDYRAGRLTYVEVGASVGGNEIPVALVRRQEGGEGEHSEEYKRGWRDAINQKHVPEEPRTPTGERQNERRA